MAAWRDLPLEEGRRGFLCWIEEARPQGSVNNPVTVVFDGHPQHWSPAPAGTVRVLFSEGGSADDQIKRMVEEDADRKNCVVVSDDKGVFLYVRSLGARVMGVKDFTQNARSGRPGRPEGSKYIPLSRQHEINEELRKIWAPDKPKRGQDGR